MEQYETMVQSIGLMMGVSWASGVNLYAAMLVLGVGGAFGYVDLPENMLILQNPMVILAAGGMYVTEFVADKIPGVDTAWDGIHTFIRIPAGAALAAGAVGDVAPVYQITAGALGGGMAATSHATKAGSRVVVNASPEPFSNWILSISEDLAVILGLWTALNHPVVMIIVLICFLALAAWLLPKIWRGVKRIFLYVGRLLGLVEPEAESIEPKADSGLSAELERLRFLRDDGALSEEEFTQAKEKLLRSDITP